VNALRRALPGCVVEFQPKPVKPDRAAESALRLGGFVRVAPHARVRCQVVNFFDGSHFEAGGNPLGDFGGFWWLEKSVSSPVHAGFSLEDGKIGFRFWPDSDPFSFLNRSQSGFFPQIERPLKIMSQRLPQRHRFRFR
jgi:hypothetical protein